VGFVVNPTGNGYVELQRDGQTILKLTDRFDQYLRENAPTLQEDFVGQQSDRLRKAGVSEDRIHRLYHSDTDGNKVLPFQRAANAVAMDREYADKTGEEADPNDALEFMLEQPKLSWKKAAFAAGLIGGIAGVAAADIHYTRPAFDDLSNTWYSDFNNGDMFGAFSYTADDAGHFLGEATLTLYNFPGSEERDHFNFGFVEPESFLAPVGWDYSWDNIDNKLTLEGGLLPNIAEEITMTFNPANVVFDLSDFYYKGPVTNGTVPNIDVISTNVVPVPGAVLLGLIGLYAAARKREMWK